VVNKLAYGEVDFGVLDWAPFWDSSDHHWARPVYGDVIVFDSPTDEGRFVKRVIGMPGDEMLIEGGAVTRNGEPLSEPYAIGDTQCFRTCGPWIVPAEHYFVLGDNRENSIDSREGWTVSLGAISGKVVWHR
jgi:signal peptidase I